MRAGVAAGLGVVTIAVAVAAVAWAPSLAAQQKKDTTKDKQSFTVYADGRDGSDYQVLSGMDQGWSVLAGGGPRLGVSIRDAETEDIAKLKLSGAGGVIIEEVTKESAAAKAGLKAGDAIVSFDGETVRSARQFTRLVTESPTGRAVKIGVVRDGKRMDVEATLSDAGSRVETGANPEIRRQVERSLAQVQPLIREFRQQTPQLRAFRTPNGPLSFTFESRGRLGVTIQELTPELAGYFGVKDGVLVAAVRDGSPAAKAGIKAGDVITTINDKPITNGDELVSQLGDKTGDVTVGLTRDKKAMSVKATIEKTEPAKRRVVVRGEPA